MDREPRQQALKAKFGVTDQRLMLTFGLLSPNKGIETVIRALQTALRALRCDLGTGGPAHDGIDGRWNARGRTVRAFPIGARAGAQKQRRAAAQLRR